MAQVISFLEMPKQLPQKKKNLKEENLAKENEEYFEITVFKKNSSKFINYATNIPC
jgi:tRNA A22 N-methylase